MPNWTHNYIHTDEDTFLKLKDFTDEEGDLDFNKFIPTPDSLLITSGSTNATDLYYFLSEKLSLSLDEVKRKKGSELLSSDWIDNVHGRVEEAVKEGKMNEDNYEIGRNLFDNYEKYGAPTWFEWRTTNWGTKWNACETNWNSWVGDDSTVSFDTPWSEPMPIFEKMQEFFPISEFSILSSYEDGGEKVFMTIDGKIELVMDRIYDWDKEKWETIFQNDSIDFSDFFLEL